MQKKQLTFFSVLLWPIVSFGQNSISGKINNQANQILAGSHIHIETKIITSDATGTYVAKNLANGKTSIHVSFLGYQSVDTVIF